MQLGNSKNKWRDILTNKVEIVKLTSAEISALWGTSVNISVVICMLTHFLETCADPEILKLLEEAKHLAQQHMNEIEQLFVKEKIVIPEAFKAEKHVVPKAPKLFSDIFYIQCVLQMSKFGVASHTTGLTISAREDVRLLFKNLMEEVSQLYNKVVSSMQEKGIFVRNLS